MPALTVPEFVARWQRATLTESSGSQQHFIDLCEVLGQPRPAEVDQEGNTYTFEKGVHKVAGGRNFSEQKEKMMGQAGKDDGKKREGSRKMNCAPIYHKMDPTPPKFLGLFCLLSYPTKIYHPYPSTKEDILTVKAALFNS